MSPTIKELPFRPAPNADVKPKADNNVVVSTVERSPEPSPDLEEDSEEMSTTEQTPNADLETRRERAEAESLGVGVPHTAH